MPSIRQTPQLVLVHHQESGVHHQLHTAEEMYGRVRFRTHRDVLDHVGCYHVRRCPSLDEQEWRMR